MDPLSTLATEKCDVCGAQKHRGFHMEQWCPREDEHAKGEEPERTVYIALPKPLLFRTGEEVPARKWSLTIAGAVVGARAGDQIWSAKRKSDVVFELLRFERFA